MFPEEKEVDVVMYQSTDYKNAIRLKELGEKKGWVVKIGKKGYLKQGNNI